MFRAKGFFVHNRPEFPKRAVVTAGMPYGNKGLHFGHIAGVFVPADVYARFLRDRIGAGNVLFVSGTDCFGSPINEGYRKLVEAGDFDGTIADYVQMNHDAQKAALDAYDISLDIFEGSGIGLSIVKKIIEEHGGKIWATSREHTGTTMYFVLRKYQEVPVHE